MLWDIAIEWGCGAVRMATREHGLAFAAPSLGAMRDGKLIAIGEDALDMWGRELPGIELVRPVSRGVISDPRLLGQWLTRLLTPFTGGTRVTRPSVVFLDNGFMRQSERETIVSAATGIGAGRCGFLTAELAAAAGAGLDLRRPEGVAVADVGAETLSVAVIALGRVAAAARADVGMETVNADIIRLVRQREGLAIGPRTAEELKLALASALPVREITARAAGLDMVTGFPGERVVGAECVAEATNAVLGELTRAAATVLQAAGEELAADLCETGLTLTGGGALLSGLDAFMNQQTGLKCAVAETPSLCVGQGMARILRDEALSDQLIKAV